MTVETAARKQSFAGGQASLTFTFKALPDFPEYISLLVTTSGTETVLVYDVDYTVAVNSDGVGGTVTVSPTYSTAYTYTVYRETSNVQSSDYEDFNQFPANTVEADFDRRTLIAQEMDERLDRTLQLPISSSVSSTFPTATADKFIGWNSAADALENKSSPTGVAEYGGSFATGADASKAASPSAGDLYFAQDTNIFYRCATGGTWTPNATVLIPTGGTLTIQDSAGTTIGTIDESGNLKIAGNLTTQNSF